MVDFFGPASCFAQGHCLCENIPIGFGITQPINIITSVFLFSTGVLMYLIPISRYRDFQKIYSLGIIFSGLGAIYLHLRMDYLGQVLDYASVTIALLLPELYILLGKKFRRYVLIIILILLILEILLPSWRFLFAAIPILYFLYMNLVYRKLLTKIAPTLSVFFLGLSFWFIDDGIRLCNQTSFFQFHAIWHVLIIFASFMALRFYNNYVIPNGSK